MMYGYMAGILVRGGPLEIPGGGVKIPPKKFVQRKMPGKKIRAAITSEKKIVQANSKVQIVLKKNSCRG
jgi:hypothetical protein